ncbi:MAG: VWA domain-containing protein [Bacteroidia bacterium]|nr:VWA domain-containing protein [Bacteroidia bacterium]
MTYAHPYFFWLLVLIPLLAAFYFFFLNRKKPVIHFSSFAVLTGVRKTLRQRFLHLPMILRLLAVSVFIIAMARPQSTSKSQSINSEGIDIVLCMDISGSMLAEDFKPNRIEAGKKVALDFIEGRENDRIGLVIFSGESFTQCPITTDHAVIKNLFKSVTTGLLNDGTAIGEGLATAVSRIKDSKAKSKVVILLTDGVNNAGSIAPATAGEIAKTFGIKVYTIGIGTNGTAPYPVKTPFGIQYQNMEVQIDEDILRQIANETGGKYFRATDNNKLKQIYAEIDRMEKTVIEVTEFRRKGEEFLPWVIAGLLLLFAEGFSRFTFLKSIP